MSNMQKQTSPASSGEPGYRWLLLRRFSQLGLLAFFLSGPLVGVWVLKGTLSASRLFDTVPLTDPFLLLQGMAAGRWPAGTALVGMLLVAGFYLVVGGRVFCSWVCPVNMVTDLAAWLRRRFKLEETLHLDRNSRYWMMAMGLLLSAVTGTIAWEQINPVTMLHRGILFGMGAAWLVVLAVFLFDLFIARHGWCGHLCPVGGCYSLLGLVSLVRVRAENRNRCTNCLDCYTYCPEPQVIAPALKGEAAGKGPVITAANCTNCGRCIDVCPEGVFRFGSRFKDRSSQHSDAGKRQEELSP